MENLLVRIVWVCALVPSLGVVLGTRIECPNHARTDTFRRLRYSLVATN
jgi:hypothetical protein